VLSGIRQNAIVGKHGKIEIPTSDLAEGTLVEIIVLVEQVDEEGNNRQLVPQDTTAHLLSTEANRQQLMSAIQNIETKTNLVRFTPEEWNEEYNLRS